ncbi:hypothetical protein SAMN05445504_0506 [Burkholderia sp. CF099]|nr:hypothetical protein SAMN05445504_0506 [Burkholderia sp. CF099]
MNTSHAQGIKQVTPDNWLEIDPAWTGVHMPSSNDGPGEAWARYVMQTKLSRTVPTDIAALFSVAQGMIVYGLFFYPLMTQGCDQILRVIEAAVRVKCVQLDAPPAPTKTYVNALTWLLKQGVISPEAEKQWHAARMLRNEVSHPSFQHIYSVGMMREQLEIGAMLINDLFRDGCEQS